MNKILVTKDIYKDLEFFILIVPLWTQFTNKGLDPNDLVTMNPYFWSVQL